MDFVFAALISFIILLISVYKNFFLAYPLLIVLFIFIYVLHKRGFKFNEIIKMAFEGGKKSFVVLKIFILIGAVTSIWMASGTVPAIVYYGINLINPRFFILYSFLICCTVSFLIGTSFGTISTVGIALIIIAKGANINVNKAAGAIIAGAYFGDRCSPMSSSAALVSHLTETRIYKNIKNMMKTSFIPFFIAVAVYMILSLKMPAVSFDSNMAYEIKKEFNINAVMFIPAFVILLFSLLKIDVKISMIVSIISASVICLLMQHKTVGQVIKYILFGYIIDNDSPLSTIIKGGGIISMLKVSIIVFISSAFSGIFEGTNMLGFISNISKKIKSRSQLLLFTSLISIAAAAFGCSQAIAIILTFQIVKQTYTSMNKNSYEIAADIENTAVVLSPLIPWNIAGLIPASMLSADYGFIPYAFYLYLLPIVNIIHTKIKEMSAR